MKNIKKSIAILLALLTVVSFSAGLTALAATDTALTVYTKNGDTGTPTVTKTYTADQMSALKETGLAGYQFYKTNAWQAVAATDYVKLDTLLSDAGVTFATGSTVTATGSDGFTAAATYDTLQTNKYFFKDASTPVEVPAVLALKHGSGSLADSTLEQIGASATNTGNIRFAYGITSDLYNSKTAAGKRLVSNVVSITVTLPEKPVLTVYTQVDASGAATVAKSYTASQLKSLAQDGTLGYQYYKSNAWQAVATTNYVTLDALLSDAGVTFTAGCSVTATGSDGFAQNAAYDTLQTNKYYFKDSSTPVEVPAVIALNWAQGSLAESTLDKIAAGATDTGSLRFAYGTTADLYNGKTAAGKRLVSNVVSLSVISPVKFSDVKEGAWYEKYVTELVTKGVISGTGNGRFSPDADTTYGEALKLAMLAAGYSVQAPTDSHWASGYLQKALADKLLPAAVDLNGTATRLEAAQITAKALKLAPGTISSPFSDTSDPYVIALYQAGIVQGSDGKYNPNGSITRTELSAIIWRVANTYKK